MRDQLLNTLHPKHFNYNVQTMNDFIRCTLRTMRADATSDDKASPSRLEALHFIVTAYKKIKLPTTDEWIQTMQFLEYQMATLPADIATEEWLYEKAESLQQQIAKSPTGWKPSDKTAAEEQQFVAMTAQQKKYSAISITSSSSNEQGDSRRSEQPRGVALPRPKPMQSFFWPTSSPYGTAPTMFMSPNPITLLAPAQIVGGTQVTPSEDFAADNRKRKPSRRGKDKKARRKRACSNCGRVDCRGRHSYYGPTKCEYLQKTMRKVDSK